MIADNEAGLLFKNKRDRKVINVDPKARPGDNSRRIELHTHEYTQVVLCKCSRERDRGPLGGCCHCSADSFAIDSCCVLADDHVTRRKT